MFARVTAAASFGFALVQLDVTIINVALPNIAEVLRIDVVGLQWLVDAYALAFAVLLLTGGLLADRLGAKRVYLAGLGAFALTSLGCGLATDAGVLLAARSLQGIAAAAMLPSSLTLLNHATAHDAGVRARAVGIWTASGAITIAAGPVLGGLLLAIGGWRSIFLVNLPLCLLGALLTARCPADPVRTSHATRRGLDLPGQLLAIVALGSLTAAVIETRPLGATHAWVLSGFALSLIAGLLFVAVESKSAAPMLPLRLFRAPNFSAAVVYGIAVNGTYYGSVFVLSLYLQRVMGYSPVEAGLAYLPLTATFFVANVWSGRLIGRVGSRPLMAAGALLDALGFVLLSRLHAHTSYWAMIPAFALIPLGMGSGVPAMTTAVLASAEPALAGRAAGVLNAARQAAGAMGVAICGALVGDDPSQIVGGLQLAAAMCCGVLLLAAGVAWFGVEPPTNAAR